MSAENDEPKGDYAPSRQARAARATGTPRSSKRRMSAGRQAWYAVLVALARACLWCLWKSCRVTVHGEERLPAPGGRPAVIVYWHQMQVFSGWLLARRARAGQAIAVLTSPSVSGEVPAALMARWGLRPVRGSSTRSSAEVLRDLYTVVAKDGQSLVLTADGPKGPRHEFKPGAVMVSRMAKVAVVPVAWAASRCTRWGSWDEFLLPWPFSRVAIVVGEPWEAPAGFQMADVPATARALGERLLALEAEAARRL